MMKRSRETCDQILIPPQQPTPQPFDLPPPLDYSAFRHSLLLGEGDYSFASSFCQRFDGLITASEILPGRDVLKMFDVDGDDEQAAVADGTSKTETATDYIDIEVLPIADEPDVKIKGNAVGLAGEEIMVPVTVTLRDNDGSESYVLTIDGTQVPPGTKILGAGGAEITNSSGVY